MTLPGSVSRPPLGERLEPHRRRLTAQRLLLEVWSAALAAAAVLAAVRLAQSALPLGPVDGTFVTGGLAVAAVVVAAMVRRRAPDDPETARLLDRHGETREVIATALELERRAPESEFSRLLHSRAVGALEAFDPAKRPPFEPGSRPGMTLVVVLVLAGMPWLPMRPTAAATLELPPETITANDVRKVKTELEKAARRVDGARQPVSREHLERLKKMLQDMERKPPTRRDALDRLSRAVNRMERDRARLTSWGRSSAVARTLRAQPQLGKVGDRLEKGDKRGAREALKEALKDPARREEAQRELQQLVKSLQEKAADSLEAGGEEGPEEGGESGQDLATPGADPVAQEIKRRDQALQDLMKQLAEMSPEDAAAMDQAADQAMDQVESMDVSQLDAEALEQLIRSMKEGKSGMGGEGQKSQGGKRVAIPMPGKGEEPGQRPGEKGGKGQGQGKGEGQGVGRELSSPYDENVKDKDYEGGASPTKTEVQGEGLTVKGRSALAPGGRVWKVKTAPQRPGGPRSSEPGATFVPEGQTEDRTVESGVIPGEYRRLVREYFDAPGARPEK